MSQTVINQKLMRVLTLLGGLQVMLTLLGAIRSKVGAVLLGTEGMGVLGVLTGSVELIGVISGLGLASAVVREVAQKSKNRMIDTSQMSSIWQWAVVCGLIGFLVTYIFSGYLSDCGFRSLDYKNDFVIISISLFFSSLQAVGLAILKGMQRMKRFMVVQFLCGLATMLVSLLFYWSMGVVGVAYAITASTVVSCCFVIWFCRKNISKDVLRKNYLPEGKPMVFLGISMMSGALFFVLVSFLLTIYISSVGGLSEVGLYKCGWTIVGGYVGMVFTAFSTEYFPRLSSLIGKNEDISSTVSNQVIISLTLLMPIILILGIMAPWIIRLLYSDEFTEVVPFIYATLPGLVFKAASWGYSYLYVAKSDTKVFLFTELLSSATILFTSIVGYRCGGVLGLGVGFSISYFLYFVTTLYIVNKRYGLHFTKREYNTLLLSLLGVGVLLLLISYGNLWTLFTLGGVLLVFFILRMWRMYVG